MQMLPNEGSPHGCFPLAASQACIKLSDLPSFRAVSTPYPVISSVGKVSLAARQPEPNQAACRASALGLAPNRSMSRSFSLGSR